MNEHRQFNQKELSLVEKIDRQAVAFERALRRGENDSIDQIISRCPADERGYLFAELLSAELEFLLTRGEKSVDLNVYIDRFPDRRTEIVGIFRATLDRLSGPPPQRDQENAGELVPPFTDRELPRPFGRYQLLRRLGAGEMGHVYLALDGRLNRKVALKIPCSSDRAALDWFRNEAHVMASVRHANLCPVFDWGVHENRHFLCMAYIEGETLASYMQANAEIPQVAAAQLASKVAAAVETLHRAGALHRDIKPANVMIDESGQPILMDFGLVRGAGDQAIEPTRAREIVGSPAFMSPEQAIGEESKIGPQSDVYSLGVLLYELLAGRLPFEGNAAFVIEQIATVDVPPVRQHRAEVDPLLEEICLKALAKDCDQRYASAAEFAAVLANYSKIQIGASHSATNAISSSLAISPYKRQRASRVVRICGAITAALLLAAAPFLWRAALTPTENAGREDLLSEHAAQMEPSRPPAIRSPKLPFIPLPTIRSTGRFYDSGQRLGNATTSQVKLLDLDDDGDLDVISREYRGPLRFWFNDGSARFIQGRHSIDHSGVDFACGDLDGDGDYDLISTMGTAEAGIFLNDGSGKFRDSEERLEWVNYGVILADFDNDGDLDVFSAPYEGEQHVWLNNGKGMFSRTGNGLPKAILGRAQAGDLDKDGDLDLFLSVNAKDRNRVYLNAGAGRFLDSQQTLPSSNGLDCQLADYDQDGDLDAFVANIGSYCQLWENNGNGHFSQVDLFPFKGKGATVRFNDFDGDGIAELLLTHSHSQSAVLCFRRDKNDFFSDRRWFPHYLGAVCDVGDLDGDGDLDVFFGAEGPDQIWLNRNLDDVSTETEPLKFQEAKLKTTDQPWRHSNSVTLADFNQDGHTDAYLCNSGADTLLINDGNAAFEVSPQALENSFTRHAVAADINADGYPDLILVSAKTERACRLLLNHEGRFAEPESPLLTGNTSGAAVGDLDGDGDIDAVISVYGGPSRILLGDGQGGFQLAEAELSMTRTMTVGLCDLDADGDMDAFFTNEGSPDQVWLNDGQGNFEKTDQTLGEGRGAAVTFGDVDGDGDTDAIVANIGSRADDRWLNDGTAHFELGQPAHGGFSSYDTQLVDFDGDGDLDLITTGDDGPSGVSWNDGDGRFDKSVTWLGEFQHSKNAIADLNGDRTPDIFVTSKSSRENTVFLNSSPN